MIKTLSPNLSLILLIIFLFSCNSEDNLNKKHPLYTNQIADGLYSNHFRVDSYGVGGDVYSLYLTDNLNFRKFVCLYYDSQIFEFSINNNEIMIKKYNEFGEVNKLERTKEFVTEYVFNISELAEAGQME